jgi:hypothetical protein
MSILFDIISKFLTIFKTNPPDRGTFSNAGGRAG